MELLALMLILMAVGATLAVWAQLAARWRQGIPLLRYVPRRPVPWNGLDVLAVCGLLVSVYGVASAARDYFLPARSAPTMLEANDSSHVAASAETVDEPSTAGDEIDRKHPLLQLLEQDPRRRVILLCFLTAAVLVPLSEEFLFRLVLQGWGERVDRRLRRPFPCLRSVPPGLIPVLAVAVFFAVLHARAPGEPEAASQLLMMVAISGVVSLATVVLGVVYLRLRAGASMADLGVVKQEIVGDFRRGLVAFLAVGIPIYGMQMLLAGLLPGVVPDPLTLFPFALVLGFLYFRTHRLVPALTLHMALNATSVTLAIVQVKAG